MGHNRVLRYALIYGDVSHGNFYRLEDAFGNVTFYPCDEFTLNEVRALSPRNNSDITIEIAYFAKVDGNETWNGPFDSEEEANLYLEEINSL